MKHCDFCGELIPLEASFCRHCGKKLDMLNFEARAAPQNTIVEQPNVNTDLEMRYPKRQDRKNSQRLKLDSSQDSNWPQPTEANSNDQFCTPSPWTRYWARIIDLWIFSWLSIYIYQLLDYPFISQLKYYNNVVMRAIVLLPFVISLEIISLTVFCTTPGKCLLGIRLNNIDPLQSFSKSWKRTLLVWIKGLWLGFFSFIPIILSYVNLKKHGQTSWDKDTDIVVTHSSLGPSRLLAIIGVIICLGISNIYMGNYINKYKIGYNVSLLTNTISSNGTVATFWLEWEVPLTNRKEVYDFVEEELTPEKKEQMKNFKGYRTLEQIDLTNKNYRTTKEVYFDSDNRIIHERNINPMWQKVTNNYSGKLTIKAYEFIHGPDKI